VHLAHCRQALETFTTSIYEQEGLPQPSPEYTLQIGSVQEEGKVEETW